MCYSDNENAERVNVYMEYRGFSGKCFELVKSAPGLQALLERICHDPACHVEVRHNYLNCYYRGGSLFRMKCRPHNKQVEFWFDPKYFNLKKAPRAAYGELKAWNKPSPETPSSGWNGWRS